MLDDTARQFEQAMQAKKYDFIDFGANKDAVIAFVCKAFGADNGLGVDPDPARVEEARSTNCDAVAHDPAQGLRIDGKVKFATLINYLNRTASFSEARENVISALKVSRDFIYIQQPFYDGDGYLLSRGLKFFWSDWSRYSNRLTSLDFHNMLQPLVDSGMVHDVRIYASTPVRDSTSPDIHPLGSSSNQNQYDPERHGEKPFVAFDRLIFRELKILASRRPECDLDRFEQRFRWDKIIYSSADAH